MHIECQTELFLLGALLLGLEHKKKYNLDADLGCKPRLLSRTFGALGLDNLIVDYQFKS